MAGGTATCGRERTTRPSGYHHPSRDLPVALPVRPPAGQEGILRGRLKVAAEVEGPRPDPVLAAGRGSPVQGPEHPTVTGPLRRSGVEGCRHPWPGVDLHFHTAKIGRAHV